LSSQRNVVRFAGLVTALVLASGAGGCGMVMKYGGEIAGFMMEHGGKVVGKVVDYVKGDKASDSERDRAAAEAERYRRTNSEAAKRDDVYIAVPANDKGDRMIVDPKTGKPVDDHVYRQSQGLGQAGPGSASGSAPGAAPTPGAAPGSAQPAPSAGGAPTTVDGRKIEVVD
jgi:hypothetical protein